MSARKTKAAKRSPRRNGAKAAARPTGPTRAQQAARARILARSGVTITKEMLDELRREFRGD
jgi:hypothetical protein